MDRAKPLVPAELRRRLRTKTLGRRIYYYPETGSTNDVALDLARRGEAEGTLVVTDEQRRGRGRRDHQWSSTRGKDLLFSFILRPRARSHELLPVTLTVSLAVAGELASTVGADVGVKWPNDLISPSGKIGGILAEASHRGGLAEYVVVGVGINVNSTRDDFPADIRNRTASCRMLTGREFDRPGVLAAVLLSTETAYRRFETEGFATLVEEYNDRLQCRGREVRVRGGEGAANARVVGVEPDGGLRVQTGKGRDSVLYHETIEVLS